MAISPEDARKYAEDDFVVLGKMETYTDIFLKDNYVGEPVKIPVLDFKKYGNLNHKIKMNFLEKYTAIGWKVELINEVNDANETIQYIQFSVAKEVPRDFSSISETM